MDDILGHGAKLLFVGFNPGLRSGETGHHYAGRGNDFWRLLHAAGLTPTLLRPEEDRRLLDFGIASTNLAARATRDAAELTREELRAGAPRVAAIVERLRPRVVAYAGKGVYLAASGRTAAPWGAQDEPTFPPVLDFVLPSPSGLVRMSFEQKLDHYRALRRLLEEVDQGASNGKAGERSPKARSGRKGGENGGRGKD